jgi:ABC-type phosphate/phosphonate transport system permease subunit
MTTPISKKIPTNRGLVRTILLVIVLLIVLAYFGLNIRSIVASQTFQDNWAFLKTFTIDLWNNYLSGPIVYLWNKIFIPFIWNPIIDNLAKK